MFIRPCEGSIISRFGSDRKNPVSGKRRQYKGVDFGGDGSPIIKAAQSGTVTRARFMGGYGNVITIAHVVNGKKYETLYAHLETILVVAGQVVTQGQHIGLKGNTGLSNGIHMHFELHEPKYALGQPNVVNPLHYMFDPKVVELQKRLNEAGYTILIDGIEGPKTETTIKTFQRSRGLLVDGIAGTKTLATLNKVVELKAKQSSNVRIKLSNAQETIRNEAIRLKITDGNNPLKDVKQIYAWLLTIPIAQRVEELENQLAMLENKQR